LDKLKDKDLYKKILKQSSFGFAYQKLILDENNNAIDYIFLDCNETFEKISGFKIKNIIGNKISQIIVDTKIDDFNYLHYFSEIVVNSQSSFFEHYSKPLQKWYKVHVYSDENLYFATTFVDITSEKNKTEQLENFFNVNLDLLCIADINGNFIKLNKEWENALGFDLNYILSKKIVDFIHKDDIDKTLFAIYQLKEQKKVLNFTNRYRCKDGSYKHIEWRSHPVGNLIYAAARDITSQKLLEMNLITQTRFQKMLTELSFDFVNVSIEDFDKKIDKVLKKIGIYFEVDRTYLFKFSEDYNYISIANNWFREGVETNLSKLKDINISEFKWWVDMLLENKVFKFNNIEKIPIEAIIEKELLKSHNIKSIFLIPIKTNKKVIGFIGMDSIDDLISWDEEKIEYLQMILNVISDAYIKIEYEGELIKQREVAVNANKAKAEFLANMSHEIRTPLNGVIGFIELLKRTKLDENQFYFVDNAIISANSLLDIINDILDFSKIEAGRLELDIVKVDIIDLLEHIFDIIKIHVHSKKIELLLNINPELPRYAYIDPLRLKQILINLLGNAVKFTQTGEVELIVDFKAETKKNGTFYFEIRDTGIGISENQKEKLFKSFSQADTSTTRKFGGTGLGLVISGLLAKKMGTKITFESEVGHGSSFYFDIKTEVEDGEKISSFSINNIKRILVIDDNQNNRNILKYAIESWGIEFTGVENGFDGMKAIEDNKPYEVVIVDYEMPYMNGIDTISMIRKKLEGKNQPNIILYSSSEKILNQNKSNELDIRFFLLKPVKYSELFYFLYNIYSDIKINSQKQKCFLSDNFIIKNLKNSQPVILVAEDVEMNKIVINKMIKNLIPSSIIIEVDNGKRSVEIAMNREIDLIFMDIQMPEMDGIEATERIRELEMKKSKIRTPIIALTAGVVSEEREKCLKSGMNDFLAKPVEQKSLIEYLTKYLCVHDIEINEEKNTDFDDIHFDKEKLYDNLDNDEKLINDLLNTTKKTFAKYFYNLSKSLKDNSLDEVKEIAHSLKGAALTIGFNKFAKIASKMYRENNIDSLNNLFNELREEWEFLLGII